MWKLYLHQEETQLKYVYTSTYIYIYVKQGKETRLGLTPTDTCTAGIMHVMLCDLKSLTYAHQ